MRTESVSGAYFIYCQCACSQLMLQSRVTSLEKTCDDSESCDSPKRKQQNVDMKNSEWPSCKDLIRVQMAQFSQGLGNKHNLNYSCVIWIMTLKMRSLRVRWCTCWCNASSRLSSCVSSTLLPMLTEASSTWHRLCREEEGEKNKKQNTHSVIWHTQDMDSLQMDRDWWPSVWKDKLSKLQRPHK